MNQIQLDEVAQQIERAFGEELPVADDALSEAAENLLKQVLADETYQLYLQDQVNRQIIRDYLINAVMLGHISTENLEVLSKQAMTREGRSILSLHMLMKSVEAADEISSEASAERLVELHCTPGSPPHMVLVQS